MRAMALLASLVLARGAHMRLLVGGAASVAAAATAASDASRSFSQQSTEHRYGVRAGDAEPPFVGPYHETRAGLDYSYHLRYVEERQRVQDAIVTRFLAGGSSVVAPLGGGCGGTGSGESGSAAPANAPRPWLVYTAGAMGAGKSHTLRWLHSQGLFPLERFVWVDPDAIKGMLPDMRGYVQHNRARAGALTHKESGFIAEIVTLEAMRRSKCLVVDGTLRDRAWYARWFGRVRAEFPEYRIAILMITAPRELIYRRALRRAAVTAREVHADTLDEAIAQVPVSFAALAPLADFTAVLVNEDDESPPKLQPPVTHEAFSRMWDDVRRAPPPAESALVASMLRGGDEHGHGHAVEL